MINCAEKLFRKVKATAAIRGKKIKDLVEEGLLLALESPQFKRGGKHEPQNRDQPISLADACLVRMAELFDDHHVFTLDSDFTVYRKHGRKPLALIQPSRE